MKQSDIYFVGFLALFFCPFFISKEVYDTYITLVVQHAIIMSFLKFAILATLGEVIGLRVTTGVYHVKGFGVLPRALFWGLTGVGIKIAFTIFANGAPVFIDHYVVTLPDDVLRGGLNGYKVLTAFAISTSMNVMFAPVFMIMHKISDLHIEETGGTVPGYFKKLDLAGLMRKINWDVMWKFVFGKTIPFFWIPAHTITFLLPPQHQVLFAAILGVVLGVIMAISSLKN